MNMVTWTRSDLSLPRFPAGVGGGEVLVYKSDGGARTF